jgi:MFS family permease
MICAGSDLLGRSMAFNATLLFTSLFGLMSAITTTFPALCVALFFLGTAVGVRTRCWFNLTRLTGFLQGSMPTDGTLLLEQLPNGKRYLVTALSIFFSFGAVFAAVAAIIVVPGNTCFASETHHCDMANENLGWKYLLIVLGLMVRHRSVYPRKCTFSFSDSGHDHPACPFFPLVRVS